MSKYWKMQSSWSHFYFEVWSKRNIETHTRFKCQSHQIPYLKSKHKGLQWKKIQNIKMNIEEDPISKSKRSNDIETDPHT